MNKRNYLAFILLIILSACGGETEEAKEPIAKADDEFKIIPLTIESEKMKLAEMIESIEVMGLEETDEGLLASVYNVVSTDDAFVFPSGTEGSVFVYSNEGKFISAFNKKGQGPEEYSNPQSVWLKGDTIFLHDSDRGNVLKLTLEGDLLTTIKLKPKPAHLYPYKDGYIGDMSGRPIHDSLNFNLVFYDKDFNMLAMDNPYAKPPVFPIVSSMNTLSKYGSEVTYKEIFGDTVFLVNDQQVSPLLKLDFGTEYFWNDKELTSDGQKAMNNIQTSGLVWIISSVKTGPSKIYLNFNNSFSESYQLFIDRVTGEYYQMDRSKSGEEKYVFIPIEWQGEKLFASMNSYDVAELMEEVGKENVKFRPGSTLENIESSENPVLVWVKFKDFK